MDRRAFLGRARAQSVPDLPHARADATLAPYTGPWDVPQATHLVRRTSVGATRADVVAALTRLNAGNAVGALIEDAQERPLPDAPSWAGQTTDNGTNVQWVYAWQRAWYAEMMAGGLREKMTLFWHDHLATGWGVYEHAAFAVDYLTFIRARALGPFRDLLMGIGKTPAMLRFLDNDTNVAGDLNENYAREILELFSMGQTGPTGAANYSQADIVEAARALTGWVVNTAQVRGDFVPARHDAGTKTVFGQTVAPGANGRADHDALVDHIFAHRTPAVAHFVAGKLYAWFVHPVPNAGVVSALASRLASNGLDIADGVRALLTSAHFYSTDVVGARLKSPIELTLGLARELELAATPDLLERTREVTEGLGQEVLNPPSVEGWAGYDDPLEYRAWITTGSVPTRRGVADEAVFSDGAFPDFDPVALVDRLSDRFDPYVIAADLAAHVVAMPMAAEATDALAEQTLLDGVPESYSRPYRVTYWNEIAVGGGPAAAARIRDLLSALVNLPEYQLV